MSVEISSNDDRSTDASDSDVPRCVLRISSHHEGSTILDITEQIPIFTPILLIYLCNITCLDISGCRFIGPTDFVDCVVACTNMKLIVLQNCTQFSQYQLAKMLCRLTNLHYVDLDGCTEIYYPAAYWIISSLHKLQMINFVPGNRFIELCEWKKLYNTFFLVAFGISF